jgi:glycosyltransferase involved in cell wall biosynthesis
MARQALVSVVMSAWNAEATVAEAVDSVRGQTYPHWELLVVDDGSTDRTAAAVEAAAAHDPRIRLIRPAAHVGRGGARNHAVGRARGEYVAINDADDVSLPHRLARQVEYLGANPDVGILGAQVADFGPWGGPQVRIRYPVDPGTIAARFARGRGAVAHQACMIRRSVFDEVGPYKSTMQRCQDLELFLRARHVTQLRNLDDVLVHYRTDEYPRLPYWLQNAYYQRLAPAVAAGQEPGPWRRMSARSLLDVATFVADRVRRQARGSLELGR